MGLLWVFYRSFCRQKCRQNVVNRKSREAVSFCEQCLWHSRGMSVRNSRRGTSAFLLRLCGVEINVDGIVLHRGMHVNFCGDADIAMPEEAADEINVLGLLIKKRAAGVAELVRREALLLRHVVVVIKHDQPSCKANGCHIAFVCHGNKSTLGVVVPGKACEQVLRDIQFPCGICRFGLVDICEPALGGQCPCNADFARLKVDILPLEAAELGATKPQAQENVHVKRVLMIGAAEHICGFLIVGALFFFFLFRFGGDIAAGVFGDAVVIDGGFKDAAQANDDLVDQTLRAGGGEGIEKRFDVCLVDLLQVFLCEIGLDIALAGAPVGGEECGGLDVGLLVGVEPGIHPRAKRCAALFLLFLFALLKVVLIFALRLGFAAAVKRPANGFSVLVVPHGSL